MSIYNPNIPQANQRLSDSQPQILGNFTKANSSFGTDHYTFADATVNNGKHNLVTTPPFVDNPPTALPPVTIAAEPKFYAFQDSANVGVLHYSRGPLNAIPTPLTHLQAPIPLVMAPGDTKPVLNFTGLTRALALVTAGDANSANLFQGAPVLAIAVWTGTVLFVTNLATNFLQAQVSGGDILEIKNTSLAVTFNSVIWTLDLLRTS